MLLSVSQQSKRSKAEMNENCLEVGLSGWHRITLRTKAGPTGQGGGPCTSLPTGLLADTTMAPGNHAFLQTLWQRFLKEPPKKMSIIVLLVVAEWRQPKCPAPGVAESSLRSPHCEALCSYCRNSLAPDLSPWTDACDGLLVRTSYRQMSW